MDNNKDTILIYSLKLTNELINKKHNLLRSEINIKFPKYKVFIFEKDDSIETDIKDYISKK